MHTTHARFRPLVCRIAAQILREKRSEHRGTLGMTSFQLVFSVALPYRMNRLWRTRYLVDYTGYLVISFLFSLCAHYEYGTPTMPFYHVILHTRMGLPFMAFSLSSCHIHVTATAFLHLQWPSLPSALPSAAFSCLVAHLPPSL